MAATAVSSVHCCSCCSSSLSQTFRRAEFSGARSEANCVALCLSRRQRTWPRMVVRRGHGGAVLTNTFTSKRIAGKAAGRVVAMAPDDEKMTRRSPLDFPVEWERPSPGRRPDIFPQFSPMKTPLPPPLPADPPEEDEDEEEKKEEDPEKEDKPDE